MKTRNSRPEIKHWADGGRMRFGRFLISRDCRDDSFWQKALSHRLGTWEDKEEERSSIIEKVVQMFVYKMRTCCFFVKWRVVQRSVSSCQRADFFAIGDGVCGWSRKPKQLHPLIIYFAYVWSMLNMILDVGFSLVHTKMDIPCYCLRVVKFLKMLSVDFKSFVDTKHETPWYV